MPCGEKAEILEMYIFLKSVHFASILAVVTIGYNFSTFVVIALQWNVIDGKSSVRIRRTVEKCVVLKTGENTLLKRSNFSVFLLQVVMFELCIRRSWKLVFTKKKKLKLLLCAYISRFYFAQCSEIYWYAHSVFSALPFAACCSLVLRGKVCSGVWFRQLM